MTRPVRDGGRLEAICLRLSICPSVRPFLNTMLFKLLGELYQIYNFGAFDGDKYELININVDTLRPLESTSHSISSA